MKKKSRVGASSWNTPVGGAFRSVTNRATRMRMLLGRKPDDRDLSITRTQQCVVLSLGQQILSLN
jgi:hypothetical protein